MTRGERIAESRGKSVGVLGSEYRSIDRPTGVDDSSPPSLHLPLTAVRIIPSPAAALSPAGIESRLLPTSPLRTERIPIASSCSVPRKGKVHSPLSLPWRPRPRLSSRAPSTAFWG